MSRILLFSLLALAGVLAVVGVVLEERSLPAWAMAAAAAGLAVIGILTKKPLERAQESFDPARRGNAHRRHLVHGKPLRVRDVAPDGPGNLGVTYSRYRDPADVHSDRLPEYVPRPELERQVREQLEAHGIVVVTGGSATGKSRLAYEVVRELYPARFLQRPVVPASGTEGVRGLVEEGLLPKRTVFWLDGVEDYLARGLRAEDLTALMPKGSGNVVVATMRVNPRGTAAGSGAAADGDRGENAQHVFLRRFAGNEVRVPRGNEGYAEPGSADPRVREAFTQDRSSVTEYLAQGPIAHQEWRRMLSSTDSHRAGAVVSAAVEARRAGRHTPLPVGLLRALHEEFVDTSEGVGSGRQSFEEALAQASAGIDGANGCLVRSDRSPGSYYAFDYLADRAQAEIEGPVGARVLEVLIGATEGPELAALGRSALRAEADEDAASLALAAADRRLAEVPGDASALGLRGRALLNGAGGADPDELDTEGTWDDRVAEAADCLRRAAEGGDHSVCLLLGTLLYQADRFEEAAGFLERVEDPDARTRTRLGKSLLELERFEEAFILFTEAKRDGWIQAYFHSAETLVRVGRSDLALEEYDTIVEVAGQDVELRAVRFLALTFKTENLLDQGRVSEGIALAEEGAERGEAWAFGLLRTYFRDTENAKMMKLWTERAADAGFLWALKATNRLSDEEAYASIDHWRSHVLEKVDDHSETVLRIIEAKGEARQVQEARSASDRETEEGPGALSGLAPVFEDGEDSVGPTEEPEPSVEERLAELRAQGRYRDVIALLTPLAVMERAELAESLAEALSAVGPLEGLALAREADPNPRVSMKLVYAALGAGRYEVAEPLLESETDGGQQWAVLALGDLYRAQDRFAEFREHYRYQVHLGSHAAAAKLALHLAEKNSNTEALRSLAWPLASFARAGGEMSASLVMNMSSNLSEPPAKKDSAGRRWRFLREAVEYGDWRASFELAEHLVSEGQFDQAEEVFFRGGAQTRFSYGHGVYLDFGEKLFGAGQRERAAAVLARVSDEDLSDEERERLSELRARCGAPPPARESEERR